MCPSRWRRSRRRSSISIDLYKERQQADYDLAAGLDAADVMQQIGQVEAAIRGWAAIRDQPITRLYILCLFNPKRMKGANRG